MKQHTLHLFVLILLAGFAQVNAGTLSFDFATEYSGETQPQGPTPWLTATLDDGEAPGSVVLTLEASKLVDLESVGTWLISLDPALDTAALVFTAQSTTGLFTEPSISTGVDPFHAPGGGLYDFQFDFANSGDSTTEFSGNDQLRIPVLSLSLPYESFSAALIAFRHQVKTHLHYRGHSLRTTQASTR